MMERSDGIAHAYDCIFRRDYQSDIDIDIDMIGRGKGKGKLASDRKMPPRRGARRGGGRGDLAAMEKRYQDMLRAALAPFHVAQQTQVAHAQTLVIPQIVPDQLLTEAKHLRDFRKYNPKTFDGSMDNPTKAQMWLMSIETIFRYMKCPDDKKVQRAVFFLEDRGTAWWETVERMLGGDVSKITWEQFKESFYAMFFSANVKYAKQQEFLNLEQAT
ncbi:gag-protease polyprotein [Cucumis melo var. makuwa]|uniref:Gag-protease polyprotein n=1 Tax=Cucumis melo var. makuwa TaxID=1194695 RepID=A0A5D3CMR2_CUCMM|nr:gag-protease polyprotein [Cucumis melo var. makuwa]